MRAALAILKFLIRWTLRGLYALSAIIFLLLAGYWLGWMSVPEQSLKVATVDAEAVSELASAPPARESKRVGAPVAIRPDVEDARSRMVRLGRSFITEPDERAAHARAVVEVATFDRHEVLNALATLENAPESGPTFALRQLLLQRLMDLDPQAALQYAREKNPRSSRAFQMVATQLLRRWALKDPAAALAAWRDLELFSPTAQYNTVPEIFHGLAAQDLPLALAELETLPEPLRVHAWRGIAELAAEPKHRDQVLATLSALPPGGVRGKSLGVALREWAREANPTEALQWLEFTSLSRDERAQVEKEIGVGFFYQDHQMAADWLIAGAQSPAERADRLERVVTLWATFDVVAAGQWLIAQGLDDAAAPAMADYARAIAADHPAEAVAWVRSIPDEIVRQRALALVEKRIRQYYPRRADALLAAPR